VSHPKIEYRSSRINCRLMDEKDREHVPSEDRVPE